MIKLPDWQARLTEYLEGVRENQFKRGVHDCVTFTRGAVLAMTGKDPFPEALGGYGTIREGVLTLKRLGYRSLFECAQDRFVKTGLIPVDPKFAAIGDIVMVKSSDGYNALGIRWVQGVLVVQQEGPFIAHNPLFAWKVM